MKLCPEAPGCADDRGEQYGQKCTMGTAATGLRHGALSIDAAPGTRGERLLCLVVCSVQRHIFHDGNACIPHTSIDYATAPVDKWHFAGQTFLIALAVKVRNNPARTQLRHLNYIRIFLEFTSRARAHVRCLPLCENRSPGAGQPQGVDCCVL